jgi:uncharacterized membrane-anchored protein YjiN (DUF445 family)
MYLSFDDSSGRHMQLSNDLAKQAELVRMKWLATGLFILVTVVYFVALLFERHYSWVGFIRAFSEAAMVGALADWFAVTALFRHPLGLPIPHTAIIPRRKDSIGESVGSFVQENFLSPDVLVGRLQSLHVVNHLARLISQPDVSQQIARQIAALLGGALRVVNDDDIQMLIERSLVSQIRKIQPAPLLGRVLRTVLRGERQRELVSEVMRLSAHLLDENKTAIRAKIGRETPWWVPSAVDKQIAERLFNAIETSIHEVSDNPQHPFYSRFEVVMASFIERLQHDQGTIARGEALKQELLQNQIVRDFSVSIWGDLKNFLHDQSIHPGSTLQDALQRSVQQFGERVQEDAALAAKLEQWVERVVVYASQEYRHQFGQLVTYTVNRWDAASTSQKIELQVGKDLQYIRINGTIVGGLAGLVIYAVSLLLR